MDIVHGSSLFLLPPSIDSPIPLNVSPAAPHFLKAALCMPRWLIVSPRLFICISKGLSGYVPRWRTNRSKGNNTPRYSSSAGLMLYSTAAR
jgi:hypothetical protein